MRYRAICHADVPCAIWYVPFSQISDLKFKIPATEFQVQGLELKRREAFAALVDGPGDLIGTPFGLLSA